MPQENKFPPKNRTARTDLGPIDIELSGRDRALLLDPNRVIMAALEGTLFSSVGRVHAEEFGTSLLSGAAGYRYSDSDVDLVLTSDELDRFVRHDLRPGEYFRIRDHFGMFYMIHDDFYDEESGLAVQPAGRILEDDPDEEDVPGPA